MIRINDPGSDPQPFTINGDTAVTNRTWMMYWSEFLPSGPTHSETRMSLLNSRNSPQHCAFVTTMIFYKMVAHSDCSPLGPLQYINNKTHFFHIEKKPGQHRDNPRKITRIRIGTKPLRKKAQFRILPWKCPDWDPTSQTQIFLSCFLSVSGVCKGCKRNVCLWDWSSRRWTSSSWCPWGPASPRTCPAGAATAPPLAALSRLHRNITTLLPDGPFLGQFRSHKKWPRMYFPIFHTYKHTFNLSQEGKTGEKCKKGLWPLNN